MHDANQAGPIRRRFDSRQFQSRPCAAAAGSRPVRRHHDCRRRDYRLGDFFEGVANRLGCPEFFADYGGLDCRRHRHTLRSAGPGGTCRHAAACGGTLRLSPRGLRPPRGVPVGLGGVCDCPDRFFGEPGMRHGHLLQRVSHFTQTAGLCTAVVGGASQFGCCASRPVAFFARLAGHRRGAAPFLGQHHRHPFQRVDAEPHHYHQGHLFGADHHWSVAGEQCIANHSDTVGLARGPGIQFLEGGWARDGRRLLALRRLDQHWPNCGGSKEAAAQRATGPRHWGASGGVDLCLR